MSVIISAASPPASTVSGALRSFSFHLLRQCSWRWVIHYFACQKRWETAEKHVDSLAVDLCWKCPLGYEQDFIMYLGESILYDQSLDQTAQQKLHLLMKIKWLLCSQLCWRNWYICIFYNEFQSVWLLNVGAKCPERSFWSYMFWPGTKTLCLLECLHD